MSTVWTYPAMVDSWHDGDTPKCHIRLTPAIEWHGVHVRMEGINAPELHAAGGTASRDYANQICPAGSSVTLLASRTEKFGRFLARIQLSDGSDFSTRMIEGGHAVAYSP